MLKIVVVVLVVFVLVEDLIGSNRAADAQALRNQQQVALLVEMEGLNNAHVSQLVNDWRQFHPTPSEEKLTELRLMAARVKADPNVAARFTVAAQQKEFDRLNDVIEPIFGGPMKADGPKLR